MENLDKFSTHEPTPELTPGRTKHKTSKVKLRQEFLNEIIADERYVNDEIFWNYFMFKYIDCF